MAHLGYTYNLEAMGQVAFSFYSDEECSVQALNLDLSILVWEYD
eukprot:CAMPEP_0170566292 /NCGR_PEP_ID=MMETSP0211-20121228/79738_1 /TAXON_ID=311385 /ORGANISM="Pseudokeronopsis sp., Strain OXSARD2" /LENGTH=43 /DNA_ID= /DNA_START= /DNA_END= /DNA_ORIENTATION=